MVHPGLPLSRAPRPLALLALAGLFALAPLPLGAAAGVTGAEILKAKLGPRAVGLGEAYTALGDDLGAALYNPAGLQAIKGPSIGFTHLNGVAQTTYEHFASAHPLFFGSLGATILLRNMPDIDNPLAQDNPVGAYDLVMGLSYAQKLGYYLPDLGEMGRGTAAGFQLKWVRSHLGKYDADSYAIDFGTRTDLGDGLMLGLAGRNFGPPMRFIQASDPLPATLAVGVARGFELLEGNRLNLAADYDYPIEGDSRLHFGAEDWLGKGLALRLGYILDSTPDGTGGLTAGMSVKLDQDELLFSLDYAFRPLYYQGFNSFESQHLFALGLVFP
jgi:hypothetical protein